MKARKRPIVVDVIHFSGWDKKFEIAEWAMKHHGAKEVQFDSLFAVIRIHTLEGTMTASPGDWIICGVNGEFYPCKPDVFAKTYDIEPEPSNPPGETL